MTDDTIRDLMRGNESLSEALDDVHVRFITIAPTGIWNFEKLGRFRSGAKVIDAETLTEIGDAIDDGLAEPTGWSMKRFSGANGPTLLFERRPDAVVDRIPDEVLQTLKKRARRDGVVAIAGPPGAGKSSVLLWATRHLSDEQVVLVSEVAPDELPGSNVVHITPPRSTAEHRDLQRLLRRTPNVSWDRLTGLEDVNTLLGGASARRRAFTLDSTDTVSTLRRIQAWRDMGYEANLDVLLQLTASVIGRAEVLDLLVFEDGEWTEVYSSSGSRLEEVKALGRAAARKHAITEPGIEPDAPTGERPASPEQVAALRAGIRKRPGHPTQDFDAPMTIPVSEVSEVEEYEEFDEYEELEDYDELDDTGGEAGPITARLDDESSAAMLDGFSEDEEDVTSSGEIDLQGFIARRAGQAHGDSSGELLPEETRQYEIKLPDEAEAAASEESEPDEILPGIDLNAGDTDSYNLENLKITRVEEVEESEMEELREMRRKNLDQSDPEIIADMPSVEVNVSDLIVEGVEEWEDLDYEDSHTAVANADVYEAAAREVTAPNGPESNAESELSDPDSATNPSISVDDLEVFAEPEDESEDTAEFSLGDKIRIIRDRLKNDEG